MDPSSSDRSWGRRIVSCLGGDPSAGLGLDLGCDDDLGRWLVAACLLGGRAAEAVAEGAFRSLCERGLDTPAQIAGAEPEALAAVLREAGHPQAERTAAILARACRTLMERHAGSLSTLAAESEGLDDLGARIQRLARGVGGATVTRFLRPLRAHWPAASDLPLSSAASAAAEHLGLAWNGDVDLEAALERLGRRACLRGRTDRCPLGADCPAR